MVNHAILPATVPFVLDQGHVPPPPPPPGLPAVPYFDRRVLTPAQRRLFHAGLTIHHERRVTFEVLNLAGDTTGHLGLATMDGQVAVTRGTGDDEVTRILTLNTADKQRVLDFAPSSPGESVFFDRMIRVHDTRCIPDLGWVDTAVITGPVWAFKRKGTEVELTAHSRERLAMGSLWTPVTLHKGMNKVDAIRMLLNRCGLDDYDFPNLPGRLPEKKSLDRFASPWAHAQKLARSLDRQLYVDGWGTFRLRALPQKTSYSFTGGDGGSVLSEPEVSRDLSSFKNTWLVLGKKPKGSKHRAHAVVKIPADHELSARDLGPDPDHPRNLAEKIEDTSLRSDKECRQLGERKMADAIRSTVQASFEAAPIPDRDPGDLVELVLPKGPVSFRLWEFSLPLAGGNMTVGSVRRVPRRR